MGMESRVQTKAKIELRKDGDGKDTRTITGYAAVFYDGSEETQFRWAKDYVERVAKGAFQRAIKEDDVRGLFNHDDNLILGRNVAGTLRMEEDSHGLRYEIDLPETAQADAVLTAVKRGDITGCSFSFIATKETFSREGKDADEIIVRTIDEVQLYDVGPVTYPAYKGTEVQARSAKEAQEARNTFSAKQDEDRKAAELRKRRVLVDARIKEIGAE